MWKLVHVLPNVLLGQSIENPWLAIVSNTDDRLAELRCSSKAAACLLEAFRDHTGRPVRPAALLIHEGAPERASSGEAIAAFRNAIALSSILPGWAKMRPGQPPPITPIWSDSFDFYPVVPHPSDDEGLVHVSAAVLRSLTGDGRFRAMPSPYIPTASFTPVFDMHLQEMLLRCWWRHYALRRRKVRFDGPLFRSLEVAYQAVATPVKNHASVHDWGVNLSLWMSAMETLAWPAKKHADLIAVLDLLENYHWSRTALNHRHYRVRIGRTKAVRSINVVQMLYKALYDHRNAFLHGNRLRHRNLDPLRRVPYQLVSLAPLLYWAALAAYLTQEFRLDSDRWKLDDNWYALAFVVAKGIDPWQGTTTAPDV